MLEAGTGPLRALAVGALVACSAPGAVAASDERPADAVEITGHHDRQRFAAGAQVRLVDARLTDGFVAGGEVSVERVTAEDLFIAGGSVRMRDADVEDLTVAGGEVLLESRVRDDLIAAGGRVRIESPATIGGDVVVAGGDVALAGRIDGNVTGAGGRLVISGHVAGDVELAASQLVLEAGARIGGRLVYRSGDAARISPQALVDGGIEHVEMRPPRFPVWAGVGIGIAAALVAILGAVVLGVALQAAIPRPLHAALGYLMARPWASWLLGFALLVAVPVAANIALVTIVGIPSGLFLYAAYGAALALGGVTAAYVLGTLLAGHGRAAAPLPGAGSRCLRTALGMLALLLVGAIPIIGWLALLAAVPAGIGAFVAESSARIRSLRFGTHGAETA